MIDPQKCLPGLESSLGATWRMLVHLKSGLGLSLLFLKIAWHGFVGMGTCCMVLKLCMASSWMVWSCLACPAWVVSMCMHGAQLTKI